MTKFNSQDKQHGPSVCRIHVKHDRVTPKLIMNTNMALFDLLVPWGLFCPRQKKSRMGPNVHQKHNTQMIPQCCNFITTSVQKLWNFNYFSDHFVSQVSFMSSNELNVCENLASSQTELDAGETHWGTVNSTLNIKCVYLISKAVRRR